MRGSLESSLLIMLGEYLGFSFPWCVGELWRVWKMGCWVAVTWDTGIIIEGVNACSKSSVTVLLHKIHWCYAPPQVTEP